MQQKFLEKTLGQQIADMAAKYPDDNMIDYTDRDYSRTWKEFNDECETIARGFMALGLKKGSHISIWGTNVPAWLLTFFGSAKMGGILVTVNTSYKVFELDYQLKQSDSEAIVLIDGYKGTSYTDIINELCPELESCEPGKLKSRRLPLLKSVIYAGEGECPAGMVDWKELYTLAEKTSVEEFEAVRDSCDCHEVVNIQYTSGTTGFPKAILHRHRALVCSCVTEQHHHGQTKDDVFLCIPPLYHTGAKMHWFGSLISGGKAVLLRGVKPEWILRTVTEEKCTIVWLLVPWAQDILDAIESGRVNLEHYLLDQWRLMHIGAQPVPPSLIKRWLKYFPHHKYDTNYGLSESIGPGCVHLGVDNIEKIGAIGKAGYLWQTRILDERGNDVAPGEIGELAVKGPGVMKCYYKNPEATAEILHGDWLWTGDMAREDKDGFIYLVDRKKDVIISGGENLYPVQIEDFLRRNEKIKDVAVIGLPDQRLGEIAAAIIELKDGADCTETEIQDFCRELPRYKRPRRVIFAKVPRNPTGKIEKPVLRQIYCGGRLVEEQTKA